MLTKKTILILVLLSLATSVYALDAKKLMRLYFSGQQSAAAPTTPSFLIDGTDYLVDGTDKLGDPI